jgi:hypothetical protein
MPVKGGNMRKFLRHPSDIPVTFSIAEIPSAGAPEPVSQHGDQHSDLNNVSVGGLSFCSRRPVDVGEYIDICIDSVRPAFRARGQVTWCRRQNGTFDVGIQFVEEEDAYRARMVEQVCHIEQYKKRVLEQEGRNLTGQQAAMEWITKYAADFPQMSGSG